MLRNHQFTSTLEDQCAFGMSIKNRNYVDFQNFRYSFNGKESDPETETQDYGMRIYNPALGRFLSVDPLVQKFPWYTPFQFSGNKPIWALDLDGLEDIYFQNLDPNKSDAIIKRINSTECGAQIIADFKNTDCNKGFDALFVPKAITDGAKGTDAYVSEVFSNEIGVADPYTGKFIPAKQIFEQMEAIKDSKDETDIEDYNKMKENLKSVYGEYIENEDFVKSLKNGRGIIVFGIDEQTVNVVDPTIPSTQKTASSTVAHEIGAHGQNIVEDIKLSDDKYKAVKEEHRSFENIEKELNDQLNKSIKQSETKSNNRTSNEYP